MVSWMRERKGQGEGEEEAGRQAGAKRRSGRAEGEGDAAVTASQPKRARSTAPRRDEKTKTCHIFKMRIR